MNLKLRFAIFITCFVAIILLASSITIFFLYKSNRVDDHYMRLRNRTNSLINEYRGLGLDSSALSKTKPYTVSLNMLQMLLLKETGNIVFRENDSIKLNISSALLKTIKRKKEFKYTDGSFECVGVYYDDLKMFIICGAIDKTGLRKLDHLFYILIGVFAVGVLVSASLSFFMVQQALKPLARLSDQMQLTTSSNMATKVNEGKGRDELEQIAKNFNAMLDRLNQGFERQKSFVQHASHELRTPLTKMLSQTEAALGRELTVEEYKRILLSLQEEQNELIELTNSLLVLSQFEKINNSNSLPEIRVDELVYESIKESKRFFNDLEIEISFENTPSSEDELIIYGNEVLLKSAFRNLIKNAYLYSSNKKVRIILNTSPTLLSVEFINEGETLSQKDAENIFIPFYRGTNASMTKGFGLGLSIINKIVEIHEARLSYAALDECTNKFAISFSLKPMANREKNIAVPENYLYN